MALDFFAATDDIAALQVEHAQFVVVSAQASDHPLHAGLVPILARVRRGLRLEVFFVSQFIEGAPVVRRAVEGGLTPQDCDPVEAEYGESLFQAVPHRGPCFAAPVVSKDGRRFGTVCCAARGRKAASTLGEQEALASIARILALALSRDEAPAGDSVWATSAAAPLALD